MSEIVGSLNRAFTLAFVTTSMFGLGLSVTLRDLVAPLRNVRLVATAVAINFLLLPVTSVILARYLPLGAGLKIGLILMGAVAGAPLSIKAVQLARGDALVAGSVVTLQVLVTVIYLPFALPLAIPGVTVNAAALALPLLLEVLLPLGAGLLMKVRYDEEADMARPIMAEVSNISLATMVVLNLGSVPQILLVIRTGAIAAILAVVFIGLAAGYFLGGSDPKTGKTLALCSAHRNYAAAFAIAESSFSDRPDVFLLLLTAALASLILVLIVAGELGRRARSSASSRLGDP